MANQHTIVRKQKAYIKPYDTVDIEKTLAVKEGKYNANVAMVNQAIQQFTAIDLIRDKDKAYLYENLKKVIGIVDDTDNIDFTTSGLGGDLAIYMSQAIDKTVLKQASNTKAIRVYNASLKELQEGKNPELYNQKNDYDVRKVSGYFDYMKGDVDNLGTMSYVNYVDVDKEMLEQAKNLKEVFPDHEVEIMDPLTGRTIKKKVSSLTRTEWQRQIQGMFNDHHRLQLEINGRAAYGYDDAAALADLEYRKDQISSSYDKEIDALKAQRVSANDDEKAVIDAEIEHQEKQKTSALGVLDTGAKTAGQIGAFLSQRQMSIDYSNMLSKKLLLSDKVDYQYLNAQAKFLEAQGKLPEIGDDGVRTRAIPVDIPKEFDPLTEFENQYTTAVDEMGIALKDAYNEIKDRVNKETGNTIGEDIDALENAVIEEFKTERGRAPSEIELHRIVVDKARKWLGPELNNKLGKAINKADMYSKALETAELDTVDVLINQNSIELFDQTFDEESQMVMFTKDGSQTTYGEYLRSEGVVDRKTFNAFLESNSEATKVYKANIMLQSTDAGKRIARINALKLGMKIPGTAAGFHFISGAIDPSMSKTQLRKYQYAEKILGDNFYEIYEKTAEAERKGDDARLKQLAPVTAGISLLFGSADQTVANEGSLNPITEDDKYEEEFDRQLRLSSANIPGMNILVVDPQTVKGAPTNALYMEILSMVGDKVEFDRKRPVSIQKKPDGNYAILQAEQTTEYDLVGQVTSEITYKEIVSDISQIDINQQNLPELAKLIEDQKQDAQIDFNLSQNMISKDIFYYGTSANEQEGLANVFANNSQLIAMSSKYEAPDVIKKSVNGAPYNTVENREITQRYFAMVDKAVKQSNRFSVSTDTSRGGLINNVVVRIKSKDFTEENQKYVDVISFPIDRNSGNFETIFHTSPQVFISEALRLAGVKYGQYGSLDLINIISDNLQ